MNVLLPVIRAGLGLPHVLVVAAILFVCGLFGLITHRSTLRMVMALLVMLVAGLLNVAAFVSFLFPTGAHGPALEGVVLVIAFAFLATGVGLIGRLHLEERTLELDPPAPSEGGGA